jgi:hypothetical protein
VHGDQMRYDLRVDLAELAVPREPGVVDDAPVTNPYISYLQRNRAAVPRGLTVAITAG